MPDHVVPAKVEKLICEKWFITSLSSHWKNIHTQAVWFEVGEAPIDRPIVESRVLARASERGCGMPYQRVFQPRPNLMLIFPHKLVYRLPYSISIHTNGRVLLYRANCPAHGSAKKKREFSDPTAGIEPLTFSKRGQRSTNAPRPQLLELIVKRTSACSTLGSSDR